MWTYCSAAIEARRSLQKVSAWLVGEKKLCTLYTVVKRACIDALFLDSIIFFPLRRDKWLRAALSYFSSDASVCICGSKMQMKKIFLRVVWK